MGIRESSLSWHQSCDTSAILEEIGRTQRQTQVKESSEISQINQNDRSLLQYR